MNATATQNADPRPQWSDAADQLAALYIRVRPGDLELPTPCTEFTVRDLLSHIVGGMCRIATVGEGGDGMAVVPRADGVPDDGWPNALAAARERVTAAWADDALLDAIVEVPWGKVPGRVAVSGYVMEAAAHGWDLAVALGGDAASELRPGPAEFAAGIARLALPAERRGGEVPFEAVRPVRADADPHARLAAWLGRDPEWAPTTAG